MKTNFKKNMLIAALALTTSNITLASVVVGNGVGVELELPLSYQETEKASQFAVTNYLNVQNTNQIYKHNGIDIDIWADKVSFVDYDSNKSVVNVRREHNQYVHSGTDYFTSKPLIVIRIADGEKGSVHGASGAPRSGILINPQLGIDNLFPNLIAISLKNSTVYGGENSLNVYHVASHEISHALGAQHENQEFNSLFDAPYNGATSVPVCMDGTMPLMVALSAPKDKGFLPWISGTVNCPVVGDERMTGNAPAMQHYYDSALPVYFTKESELKYNPSARTPSTLTATVLENINNRYFDFKLSREQTNATTGTLFIAGNGIGLTPLNFNFANGETEKTISVDFTKIHNLLKNSGQNLVDGKDYIDTVYAVAQTENEVVKGLVNISAANTQYTFVPNDKEPDVDGGDGNDNGGGGGGSSSFALLFGLLALAGLRKRKT